MNRRLAAQTGHRVSYGVYVRAVLANSPAQAAGLQAGSVIISMGGQPVDNLSVLRQLIMQYEVGDEVEIVVALPTGEQQSLTVRLGPRAGADVGAGRTPRPPPSPSPVRQHGGGNTPSPSGAGGTHREAEGEGQPASRRKTYPHGQQGACCPTNATISSYEGL